MLVSLMARLNAISMRNNAAYAMMQNRMNMMSMMSNPSFGRGEPNYGLLNAIDTQMQIDNVKNGFLYQIASAQEQYWANKMKNERQQH